MSHSSLLPSSMMPALAPARESDHDQVEGEKGEERRNANRSEFPADQILVGFYYGEAEGEGGEMRGWKKIKICRESCLRVCSSPIS